MSVDDRLAILDVISRWSHAADEGDIAAFDRIVGENASLDVRGDVVTGRASIAEVACQAPAGHQLRRHLRNSVFDDLDDLRATVRSYYLLTAAVDGGRPTPLATGVYVDELTKTTEGWRIDRRTVRPDVEGETTW